MNTVRDRASRHFPYKHPRFSVTGKEPWKKSVYYWWWAYLRQNKEYLACCVNGGEGEMSALYEDFGDVRADDFQVWWKSEERGARLFAEPVEENSVRLMNSGELVPDGEDFMAIVFPAKFPKKYILKQCQMLLADWHPRKRGDVLARRSDAKYQYNGQPDINALALTMLVYEMRQTHPEMKLWELGNHIAHGKHLGVSLPDVFKQQKFNPKAPKHKVVDNKNLLAIAVSRYLRVARQRIEAAGNGHFPKSPRNSRECTTK